MRGDRGSAVWGPLDAGGLSAGGNGDENPKIRPKVFREVILSTPEPHRL